jgi:hypothetical protein
MVRAPSKPRDQRAVRHRIERQQAPQGRQVDID